MVCINFYLSIIDRYQKEEEKVAPLSKKLDFADQIHQTKPPPNKLRDSNRYFGQIQLLGKRPKVLSSNKYGQGFLLLQPGPKFPTKLYQFGSSKN